MNHKPFKSHKEEADFWKSTRSADSPNEGWIEEKYVPRATIVPREHVYRLRMDDEEMNGLQKLALRRKQPASTVVRDLILSALRQTG